MSRIDRIIDENINRFLINENYRQLYLPFDGNSVKPNYLQLVDYFEENGIVGLHKGQVKRTNYNPLNDEKMCLLAGVYHFYYPQDSDVELEEYDYMREDEWEAFIKGLNSKYGLELDYEEVKPTELVNKYPQEFEEIGRRNIEYLMEDVYIIKNNMVYVERAISVADLLDNKSGYFDALSKYYGGKGFGCYWSYEPGYSDAYYAGLSNQIETKTSNKENQVEEYNGIERAYSRPRPYNYDKEIIRICGYVDLRHVVWSMGYPLAVYNDEWEIRLTNQFGGEVQVSEITTEDGKHLPIPKPFKIKI